jgi:hypothetical protein
MVGIPGITARCLRKLILSGSQGRYLGIFEFAAVLATQKEISNKGTTGCIKK